MRHDHALLLAAALAAGERHAFHTADSGRCARRHRARQRRLASRHAASGRRALVDPYADDAVFVTATGESVKGREAIARLMRDRFKPHGRVVGGTLQQDDLVAVGSMIYEWGHADWKSPVPADRPHDRRAAI